MILFLSACLVAFAPEWDSSDKTPDALARAVDEFKIQTRELGMRSDSAPVAQTHTRPKMLWHGRLYENFRNDALDAIPHEVKQNGSQNAILRRNQFGFNIGGPVIIPHLVKNAGATFFSLSYEGVRERISRAALRTIPTMPERTGDFSQTVDQAGNLLPVYDPNSTRLNPGYNPDLPVSTSNLQYLRDPFGGNRIPASRLSPISQKALSLYPAPNVSIGPFSQNNYFVDAPETDLAGGIIAKVDHAFGRHRITWDSAYSNGFLGAAKYFPNIANPGSPDQSFSTRRGELDYIFTVTPQTLNTLGFSASSSASHSGDPSQAPFPLYQLDSYLGMGTAYPNPRNARNTFELRDGLSTRRGKHSLRITAQADFYHANSFQAAYPAGLFQFSSGLTSLPGIVDTGYGFASFVLGLPQYAERSVITSPSYFRKSYQSISVSDKYELSKDLTVSVGLNLSRRTGRSEKYSHQSTIDPSGIDPSNGLPGALVFAGMNGVPSALGSGKIDLDPSIGLAWNPFGGSKTVVRASFSRSHGQIPIYNGQWGTQGFNARQTFVSPNTQLSPAIDFAAGIPQLATPLPDLSPAAADNTMADLMDLSGREPVYQSASFSIERELPLSILLSVGASYRGGRDLLVGDGAVNPNAINPARLGSGNALYEQAFHLSLQPYPQFTGFELFGLYPAGRYQRDSSYLRLEKRASFGLSLSLYYEFSKQLDDYSGPYGNQDLFNLANNWSLTAYNPPQYLQLSYVYELPFGSNKPFFSFSDWRRSIADGWSLSGTMYWNDGTPLALHPEYNNTGGVLSTLNVNVVPGVDAHVPNPGPALWYNPAAFDQPSDFTLGNASRTNPNLLNPGTQVLDLSIGKRVSAGVDRAFELSVSAFNALNHGDWNHPDPNIGPSTAPNVNAGRIIGSHGGRVIQLGLKFSF
jgi:hypothetical protein